jgi:uncharacterized lipoprotein YmbA
VKQFYPVRISLLLITVMGLLGCSSSGSAPIKYYLVDNRPLPPLLTDSELSLEIVDVHIPQYLERYQIAARESASQLVFSESHQWGENLRKNLMRTLAMNLSGLLGTVDVGTPITRTASKPDYRVQVSVIRFERDPQGYVRLTARWQVSSSGQPIKTNVLDLTSERRSEGFPDTVAAMADLFGDLSTGIAQSIVDFGIAQ